MITKARNTKVSLFRLYNFLIKSDIKRLSETSKHYFSIILLLCLIFTAGCSNLDVKTLNDKAAELMAKGDIDGAIARLESIQDLNPNFPQTNYNLGIAYQQKKEYDKSVKYLERSVQLKPDFYQAHLTLAVVYEEMADYIIQTAASKQQNATNSELTGTEDISFTPEEKQKLALYYTHAKKATEDYLKYAPVVENKAQMEEKITEFNGYIQKYSEGQALPVSGNTPVEEAPTNEVPATND